MDDKHKEPERKYKPKHGWRFIPGDKKDTYEWTGGPNDPNMTERVYYDMRSINRWPSTRTSMTQSDEVPSKKKKVVPSQKKQNIAVLPVDKTQESEKRKENRRKLPARTV